MTHFITLTDRLLNISMKLLPLICLNTLCATAGALLVQSPPSVSVTPGSKVSLSCDITHMGRQCSAVVWLHVGQVSGLSVCTQFVSAAQTGTLCRLEISSATLQDAGRYYCVYINGLMLVTGDGTTVTVTESVLHSPVVDLLVPSDNVDSSLFSVPLICLASGLEDTGRVTVNWEVDWEKDKAKLRSRILPQSEAGVIGIQVYVPVETWRGGAEVSCVLTDGELEIRKTVSSRTGKSSDCVFPIAFVSTVCVLLLVVTVTLSILLSCRRRGLERKSDNPPAVSDEASADLHYAALRFETSGRRNIS